MSSRSQRKVYMFSFDPFPAEKSNIASMSTSYSVNEQWHHHLDLDFFIREGSEAGETENGRLSSAGCSKYLGAAFYIEPKPQKSWLVIPRPPLIARPPHHFWSDSAGAYDLYYINIEGMARLDYEEQDTRTRYLSYLFVTCLRPRARTMKPHYSRIIR